MQAQHAASVALVLPCLAALPHTLTAASTALARVGGGTAGVGTLHVLLNGAQDELCVNSAAAAVLLGEGGGGQVVVSGVLERDVPLGVVDVGVLQAAAVAEVTACVGELRAAGVFVFVVGVMFVGVMFVGVMSVG